MTQCSVDNELCFLHEASSSAGCLSTKATKKLLAVMAKHVDDLKITGSRESIMFILKAIEKVYGELKIVENNFTNCGIRHIQDATTKEITLDQNEYVKGIHVISHPDMSSKGPNEFCCPDLHQLYWSILGAINFATLSRADIAVFVSALQRQSRKPKMLHCKRHNAVVRWAQRNPKVIRYRTLD